MIEYRPQIKWKDTWEFVTDLHGRYYSYKSLANAKRYGPNHAPSTFDRQTGERVYDLTRFRIVVADIDWQPID